MPRFTTRVEERDPDRLRLTPQEAVEMATAGFQFSEYNLDGKCFTLRLPYRISGSKGRDKRPGYDALLKAVVRREIDLIAAWSVDRLGRSMQDLVAFLEDLRGNGADLYLHQQALDTTTASGRALFGMMAVFAEFERAMIQERVNAGLARARSQGKRLGRPTIGTELENRVREMRASGMGMVKVAKTLGIGVSAVQRVSYSPPS